MQYLIIIKDNLLYCILNSPVINKWWVNFNEIAKKALQNNSNYLQFGEIKYYKMVICFKKSNILKNNILKYLYEWKNIWK